MLKPKKLLVLIIFSVSLIGMIWFAYKGYARQISSPPPSTEKVQHKDANNNFSLLYPRNLIIDEPALNVPGLRKSTTFWAKEDRDAYLLGEKTFPIFGVIVNENTKNLTTDEWVKNNIDPILVEETVLVIFGSNQYIRIKQKGEINHYSHITAIGGNIVVIATPVYKTDDQYYESILSDFRPQ